MARSGQRRLHAQSGRAAPLSAPLQPQGLQGAGARRRGSPALAAAPASIAAPRALIGLGAATTGEESPTGHPSHPPGLRAPDRGGAEGAEGAAPPARASPRTVPGAEPALPSQPPRPSGPRFTESPVQGGAVGPGRRPGPEGSRSATPGGSRGSTLPVEGRGAWPPPLFAWRARTQLAFGGSGKPSRPRVFPTTISPRPEIELGPGLASGQKNGKVGTQSS